MTSTTGAVVRAVPSGALDLVGIGLYGPKNAVDKDVKGARLYREAIRLPMTREAERLAPNSDYGADLRRGQEALERPGSSRSAGSPAW